MKTTLRRVFLLGILAGVAACGGSADTGVPVPAPLPVPVVPASAPGGLFVGYYAEDPVDNPEDPTLGAFSLNLPNSNGAFSGSMFFTYEGCQTSNVGMVSGNKADLALSGMWAGTVDGLPQSGSYSGTYDSALLRYQGNYTNSAGKQYRDLRPCIEYFIAGHGRWEMFPVDASVPTSFAPTVSNRTISWTGVSGAAQTLVYVLDPVSAQGSGNPVVWQSIFGAATNATVPVSVSLQAGKEYVAVVAIADLSGARIAFGSRRFVP
jgi:hypothetical protein